MHSLQEDLPLEEDLINRVSFEIATEICKQAAVHVGNIQVKRSEKGHAGKYFLRAKYILNCNVFKADRLCECSFTKFGSVLQEYLNEAVNNTEQDLSAPCWLTILSADEELVLQHAFFAIVVGNSMPVSFSLCSVVGACKKKDDQQNGAQLADFAQVGNRPSALSQSVVNYCVPPAECIKMLPTPTLGGRSQSDTPKPASSLQCVNPQDFVSKREPNPYVSLSLSLPRLQTSATYVPFSDKENTPRLLILDKQLMITPEKTVLVDPSSYTHQTPESVRRNSVSPSREKLWNDAEKSMTRYTGFRLLDFME